MQSRQIDARCIAIFVSLIRILVLFFLVDAIAQAGGQVDRMLLLRYASLIENTDSIKTYIDDSIRAWSREAQRKFDVAFSFLSS
jgi:hypothetical protein